jgi:hypothetical protein
MQLKIGNSRIALVCENYVFKFANITHFKGWFSGPLCNLDEFIIWHIFKDDRLAPVVFFIPFIVLVQRRVKDPIGEDYKHSDKLYEYFHNLPIRLDTHNDYSNFGVQGKLQVFDYAMKPIKIPIVE